MPCGLRPTGPGKADLSTCGMVLHRFASGSASHTLRVCGVVAAYAFVLVTGTAVLIAALGAYDSGPAARPAVQLTAAELVILHTAERGVQAPDAFLLASRPMTNDKRGF